MNSGSSADCSRGTIRTHPRLARAARETKRSPLFLSVVEEQRIAGDAARVCWKDGCLERVERGAVGCERHPFERVLREGEPTVRVSFRAPITSLDEMNARVLGRGYAERARARRHRVESTEPAGDGLWWGLAELPNGSNVWHARVVAGTPDEAAELCAALEAIPTAFVANAIQDRAFVVLVPAEVHAIRMMWPRSAQQAKGGGK